MLIIVSLVLLLWQVSDQKPLSTWTVKQGQTFSCPAVYNSHTKEYVAISDSKVRQTKVSVPKSHHKHVLQFTELHLCVSVQVIRIWKEEDLLLEKVFKATVSLTLCVQLVVTSAAWSLYVKVITNTEGKLSPAVLQCRCVMIIGSRPLMYLFRAFACDYPQNKNH